MGKPKHGKNSARSKSCEKYKMSGRLAINKKEKAEKIEAGTYRKRKPRRTKWMEWDRLIRNTPVIKPTVDKTGVRWGTSKDAKVKDKTNINKK